MSTYLQHIRQMERADWLDARAHDLAALLKSGEAVRVSHRQTLTQIDVEEHAECNDLSRDEACDQLAAHYVEEWSNYEWVNS